MLFPSKVTSFNESVFPDVMYVAKCLRGRTITVSELFEDVRDKIKDIDDFFVALDILFAIGEVKFNPNTGVLNHVN